MRVRTTFCFPLLLKWLLHCSTRRVQQGLLCGAPTSVLFTGDCDCCLFVRWVCKGLKGIMQRDASEDDVSLFSRAFYPLMFSMPQWSALRVEVSGHRLQLRPSFLHQPQWCADEIRMWTLEHCATCKAQKRECLCASCALCNTSVGTGTRHHCRKCWRTVCGDCWTRERHTSFTLPKQKVCDDCAVLKALASTSSEHLKFGGLYLLRSVSELPRHCVSPKCEGLAYRLKCPLCSLPTVPTAPHAERLVKTDYFCCSKGSSSPCAKCADLRLRMNDVEHTFAAEELERFDTHFSFQSEGATVGLNSPSAEETAAAAYVRSLLHPELFFTSGMFLGAESEKATTEILLASLCASICYEYPAYPHTSLHYSDVPLAKCLVLRYCSQLYSLFEGPHRVVYVAFPGTHDARTAMTDLRFSRTTVTTWTTVHGGMTGSGRRVVSEGRVKLWEFKAHKGFYDESESLRKTFPAGMCRLYVEKGYRVVFTGHSLGGALAEFVALQHLIEDPRTFNAEAIRCVTFGAPLIGNTSLRRIVERCGWEKCFHHIVYRSDIIPRTACGTELPRDVRAAVEKGVRRAVDAVQGKLQSLWSNFKARAGRIADSDAAPADAALLSALDEAIEAGDAPVSDQPTLPPREIPIDSMNAILDGVGNRRKVFDCFGRYHFLFRTILSSPSSDDGDGSLGRDLRAAYDSSLDSNVSFEALKSSQKLKSDVRDHLMDSYNAALALLLRRPIARTAHVDPYAH